MTKVCPEEFIEFANALADAARPVIRRHFRTPIAVDTKSDESPVTIADRDAETAMRSLIAATYPDHGIFGEEHGRSNSDAQYTWVLDPIDGTKAFITGRPIFGTLVALVRDGIPILGVIDQAILDERWVGATGHATTFNDAVVETRRCSSLAKAIVNTTSPDMFNAAEKSAFAAL
jgi:inositol-phosphate phosphatase/L-galactose 1-phosphate phosphatase/histidinol-phosphatase